MSDVGADGPVRDDRDPDRTDDDALADAILASFTRSDPVVPTVETSAQNVSPATGASMDEELIAGGTGPRTHSQSPPPPEATPQRVWDVDDESPAGSGRVWDLGDLPPRLDFAVPPPSVPAEPAGRPPTEEAEPDDEPWTRLVESSSEDGPVAPPHDEVPPPDPTDVSGWAPPVWVPDGEWTAPAAEPDAPAVESPPSARRQPTPWFDLASAPPPDPSTSVSPRAAVDPDDDPVPRESSPFTGSVEPHDEPATEVDEDAEHPRRPRSWRSWFSRGG